MMHSELQCSRGIGKSLLVHIITGQPIICEWWGGRCSQMNRNGVPKEPEGQKCPGRPDILQERNLTGTGANPPCVLKDEQQGRWPVWLSKELCLGLKKKKRVDDLWEKRSRQLRTTKTLRDYAEKIRRTKALKIQSDNNKKSFYKYIRNRRRAKGTIYPLLDVKHGDKG